jgi:hypothetical protein
MIGGGNCRMGSHGLRENATSVMGVQEIGRCLFQRKHGSTIHLPSHQHQ